MRFRPTSPPTTERLATLAELERAFGGPIEDDALDAACRIVTTLVTGAAAGDMSHSEPGLRVAAALLDVLAERPPNLVRVQAVIDLRNWAEAYEQHVTIAERCARVLAREEIRRFVADRPREAN